MSLIVGRADPSGNPADNWAIMNNALDSIDGERRIEVFKIVSGVGEKPINTAFYSLDIDHNLGFTPMPFGFLGDTATQQVLPVTSVDNAGLVQYHIDMDADESQIHLAITTPNYMGNTFYANSFPLYYRIYLMHERLH